MVLVVVVVVVVVELVVVGPNRRHLDLTVAGTAQHWQMLVGASQH